MELSEKILGIKLESIKDSEERISYYIKVLFEKIKDCEKELNNISQEKKFDLSRKSKLKKLKLELNESHQLLSQLWNLMVPFEQERLAKRIESKNKACDELISKILSTKMVLDYDNNLIELEEETKLAFIEAIKKFKEVNGLSYQYDIVETADWSMAEGLSFDGTGIEIVVTTNDYGIAAKSHDHIKKFEEMLQKFRLTQKANKSGEKNTK